MLAMVRSLPNLSPPPWLMAFVCKILATMAVIFVPRLLGAESSPAHFLTALERGDRQKIVVYGTSLTANSAWPAEFQRSLHASYGYKLRIVNAASGGKDSRWGLANLRKRVLSEKPDTVFIEFSINDALEKSQLSVAESMENLTKMISIIRHEQTYCDVILMVMNPPTGKPLEERPKILSYHDGCRRVAIQTSCRLIQFAPLWREIISKQPELWREYVPDGIHPNKRACREVIVPYLLQKVGYALPGKTKSVAP